MSNIELISTKPDRTLLGDYIFCGVESEGDGEVVEKYSRDGVEYLLTIPKQDNVRHGQAEMVDEDGIFIASLTFTNGDLSGPWSLRYSNSVRQFKGYLENGKKNGLFTEYNNEGEVLWRGIYRDNTAIVYNEIRDGHFYGYYEERVLNGKRLSISQMKQNSFVKDGRSLEFLTNQESDTPVSEKYFKNGNEVYERVHIEDTKMREYNEGGNQVYEGSFIFMEGEFLRWGKGKEYECENVKKYDGEFANGFYHGEGSLYRNGKLYFKGKWKCGYPEGNGTLYGESVQVKRKGEWHLGYLNGVDYEADRVSRMDGIDLRSQRSGMVVERMRRIEWKEEIERIKKEEEKKRQALIMEIEGIKKEEEKKRQVEIERVKKEEEKKRQALIKEIERVKKEEEKKRQALIMEIERVKKEEENRIIQYWNEKIFACPGLNLSYPRGIEEIVIGDNSMNDDCGDVSKMKLDLSEFKRLTKIEIGNACFQNNYVFILDGLERLESVKIGWNCFKISDKKRAGVCRTMNCPNLRQLEIGGGSFQDFKQFELWNVNSLQSIQFGGDCFQYADCILMDLPSLQQVSFGGSSFCLCHLAQFENLPKLTTISFNGSWALQGYNPNRIKTPINGYPSYDNKLIMKNLPLLNTIQCQGDCKNIHRCMGRVILENIPNLPRNKIHYGEDSFYYTADLRATNANDLTNYIRNQPKYWNEKIFACVGLNLSYSRGIEEIVIENNSMNYDCGDISKMKLDLSEFKRLKRIEIGNECFNKVREYVLDGLENLESVKIGYGCFRVLDWKERDDGICRITNCPNLTQLKIGEESFRDFKQFELSNVNSLQSIIFGSQCFQYAENCILKDLPSLQQVSFWGCSFRYCHLAQFENLPKLTTMSFKGSWALDGDGRDNRKTTINGHASYDNTLIMKNLPSLTTIQYQGGCRYIHERMGRVILDDIPNLTENNIDYGNYPFYYTADVQATNANNLANYVRGKSQYL